MKRRDFFKSAAAVGLASVFRTNALGSTLNSTASGNNMAVQSAPDLVAVMGGEPAAMLTRALKELGGIGHFVKKGYKVVIKPNIGWDRKPELAANTNPELVGTLVRLCKSAGASEVVVFDHTCHDWKKSGIEKAVTDAGGKMVPGNDETYYTEIELPRGVNLKKTKIHKSIVECDVWFNVPVLKHHGGAKNSIAMKNLMGIVWERGFFHGHDLHQCIADIATYHKAPALNIVDAYRIMKSNGPQGKSESDVATLKSLIISPDFVAADTASMKLFSQVQPTEIKDVRYIALAEKLKVGTQNIESLNVKRIKM